jgi:formylglycine-generating enzyme
MGISRPTTLARIAPIVAGLALGLPALAGPATSYQCGEGTPNPLKRTCDCPKGTTEVTTERGIARCHAPAARPPTCPPEAVAIPGGTYAMSGDKKTVTVAPFCLDKTEVTVDAYTRCIDAGRCLPPRTHVVSPTWKWGAWCNYKHPDGRLTHPVNCVSWLQARTYCAFAYGGRLPNEDEWEWAARNGEQGTVYPWGDAAPDATRTNGCGAECPPNAKAKVGELWPDSALGLYEPGDPFPETAPVGSFPLGDDRWHVHDLSGNLFEWTGNRLDAAEGTRNARGGAFRTNVSLGLSAAAIMAARPDEAYPAIGFRCAKTP